MQLHLGKGKKNEKKDKVEAREKGIKSNMAIMSSSPHNYRIRSKQHYKYIAVMFNPFSIPTLPIRQRFK